MSNKNPLVSIIIPTKNSGRTIQACLQSCKDQTYPHIEIIVVDNFSTDGTDSLAHKFTDHVYQQWPERSAQRNYGVLKCLGDYVLIIDSDMKLSPTVIQDCVKQIEYNSGYKWLVIPEESFGEWFWAKCKKLERSFYVGVDWMEAARFFDRKTFDEVWWYDEKNIGTEDYDLPQRIQGIYGKACIGRIDSYIYHDEWRLSLWRTCQKKFYYAQRLNYYKSQNTNKDSFNNQSSILNRYLLFLKKPKQLLSNPVLGLGMLWMKTTEMVCGASGYIVWKFTKVDNIY